MGAGGFWRGAHDDAPSAPFIGYGGGSEALERVILTPGGISAPKSSGCRRTSSLSGAHSDEGEALLVGGLSSNYPGAW